MRPVVSLVLGRCTVRKSASATAWSSDNSSTPIWRARSADTNGSYATRRMLNPLARSATSLPMRPRPMMASVLSANSTPSHLLRSQRPAFSAACAWGTLRACDMMSAIVCSAADTTLLCGAFTTMTPRFVAAGTSTLSRPIPARPTTISESASSSTSAVTWVADRMMSAWAPRTTSGNLSRSSSTTTS